jgi:hypothetical protein
MISFFKVSNYIGLLLATTLFVITLVRFNTLLLKSRKYLMWFLQIFIIIWIVKELHFNIYSIIIGEF